MQTVTKFSFLQKREEKNDGCLCTTSYAETAECLKIWGREVEIWPPLQWSKEVELIYKIGEAPPPPNLRRLCSYADVKLCKISLKLIEDQSYLCNVPWRKYVRIVFLIQVRHIYTNINMRSMLYFKMFDHT